MCTLYVVHDAFCKQIQSSVLYTYLYSNTVMELLNVECREALSLDVESSCNTSLCHFKKDEGVTCFNLLVMIREEKEFVLN